MTKKTDRIIKKINKVRFYLAWINIVASLILIIILLELIITDNATILSFVNIFILILNITFSSLFLRTIDEFE